MLPDTTLIKQRLLKDRGQKILLVEDISRERNERAVMLSSHGYDIDTAENAEETQDLWDNYRPDLILLGPVRNVDKVLRVLERIRQGSVTQRIAFLPDNLVLCPLYYNGSVAKDAQLPGTFLDKVAALLCTR
jgi:PleD family two-component response regulator